MPAENFHYVNQNDAIAFSEAKDKATKEYKEHLVEGKCTVQDCPICAKKQQVDDFKFLT